LEDLILIPYLINLILLTLVRYYHKDYITSVFLSAVSYSASYKLARESKSLKSSGSILLNIIFYVSASIFIAQVLIRYMEPAVGKNLFVIALLSFIILFLIILLNKILNFFSAKIFRLDDIRREFNQNINFFNQTLGMILFPTVVLISYSGFSQIAVYIGISAVFISYLLRIIRLIKINFVKDIHIFYMFLYLCAFEIIPILYLIKALFIQ
jgi:hypothetical protein